MPEHRGHSTSRSQHGTRSLHQMWTHTRPLRLPPRSLSIQDSHLLVARVLGTFPLSWRITKISKLPCVLPGLNLSKTTQLIFLPPICFGRQGKSLSEGASSLTLLSTKKQTRLQYSRGNECLRLAHRALTVSRTPAHTHAWQAVKRAFDHWSAQQELTRQSYSALLYHRHGNKADKPFSKTMLWPPFSDSYSSPTCP